MHDDVYGVAAGSDRRDPRRAQLARRRGARARRDRAPLRAPARGAARGVRRTDDHHHGDRIGKVAVLSAADARGSDLGSDGTSPLSVPDQGAGPGPGSRRCTASACTRRSGRRSTTATRRARALRDPQAQQPDPHQSRHAPPRDPAPPRGLGRPVRPTWRSWWSTRPTFTAACSARTSATCCAGCAAPRPSTAPSRAFC